VIRHISYLIAFRFRMTLSVQSSLRKSMPYSRFLLVINTFPQVMSTKLYNIQSMSYRVLPLELSHSCGIGRYSEKSSSIDDSNTGTQGAEIMEKIALNDILGYENRVLFDADALLSWMFTGPTTGEQLASWTRKREEKAQQGMEILQTLEKEFYHLQSMYERKCEHLSYEEAVQAVEDLCLEEGKKREHVTEFRREELIESDNDVMFISNRFELDAISNILKEAETLNLNQFGFEDTCSSVTSHICDLESSDDEDWRAKDHLHQVDSCIEARLEDLAEKDATKKSDAVREAFLAELALDSRKGSGGGGDNSKH
ncbi:hypothetical protein U1Q18_025828, partial [Sarracenia purpurea var. burkii]